MRESLKTAQKKYDQKCKSIRLRLRQDQDQDIIEWMERQPNITESIKQLIRASE